MGKCIASAIRGVHGGALELTQQDVTASFFAPWKPNVEPYIRVATGDYPGERRVRGRDNAIAGFLCSVAHEVVHYQQWIDTGEITERGVSDRASNLVNRYALTTAHP